MCKITLAIVSLACLTPFWGYHFCCETVCALRCFEVHTLRHDKQQVKANFLAVVATPLRKAWEAFAACLVALICNVSCSELDASGWQHWLERRYTKC